MGHVRQRGRRRRFTSEQEENAVRDYYRNEKIVEQIRKDLEALDPEGGPVARQTIYDMVARNPQLAPEFDPNPALPLEGSGPTRGAASIQEAKSA